MEENKNIDKPLVSVLITTYNREKYVAAAINSVLASTYTNFEVIVCDDCSKDNTINIAKEIAQNDKRVKIYVHEKNLGDYPNRNRAASYATGKYLKYVDADDLIYPWGLEILVRCMEENLTADWGLCSLIQVNENKYPILITPQKAYYHNYFVSGIFQKAPLSSIIKKELFDKVGGFKPIRMCGDCEMWHRLALDYNLLLLPDGIVWYREHGEQEVASYRNYVETYEQIKSGYLKNERCPLSKIEIKQVFKKQRNYYLKSILRSAIKFNYIHFIDNFKRLKYYL